jgi:hypothetical protein
VTSFDVLFQHLPKGTEDNHRKSQPEYSVSLTRLEARIVPVGSFNARSKPRKQMRIGVRIGTMEGEPWSVFAHRLK